MYEVPQKCDDCGRIYVLCTSDGKRKFLEDCKQCHFYKRPLGYNRGILCRLETFRRVMK